VPEAFIGKASKGEVVVFLLRTLGNAAYGSLRLARRVTFDEKKVPSNLNLKIFSSNIMQDSDIILLRDMH
jgi:hypothetical protein